MSRPEAFDAAAVLSVRGLGAVRAGRPVLHDISFDARAGEVVAILGPNGAGKTTLLECVAGLLRPSSGTVSYAGEALSAFASRARTLAYMPDDAEPAAELRVVEVIAHARRFGRLGEAEATALVGRLGLTTFLRARAGELSRGERRRLALFVALCAGRPVVLLDEPFATFDPLQLVDVLAVVRERARSGAAIVASIHQTSDAEKIADRVLLLREGRLVAFGALDELRARAGLAAGSLEEVFVALLGAGARP